MIQDYGFRLYNPAIGKFLSVDPLFKGYPMLTPYQFASNTPIQAIDLDGLEAAIVITSRTVTLEFERRVTAKGIVAAVNWLVRYRDGSYPKGFVGAAYTKAGGHAWLDLIRAQNIEVPDEVVVIHNKTAAMSGIVILGIKDVNDSENQVFSVKWGVMPGESVVKKEEVLPNGFVVEPSCEDCNGDPDGRRPVGPVKTIKGLKTTPGPGYIIDFFRKIFGHKQGDKFFPEETSVPEPLMVFDGFTPSREVPTLKKKGTDIISVKGTNYYTNGDRDSSGTSGTATGKYRRTTTSNGSGTKSITVPLQKTHYE